MTTPVAKLAPMFRRSRFATRNAWLVCIEMADPKKAGGGDGSTAKDPGAGGD
jgi:hypothetical protein